MTLRATLDPTDPAPPGTLYGRDTERAALRHAFDEMLTGRGRLALIGGEAGIGKTALVEDLALRAEAQAALLFVGHSYDVREMSPFTPWIEILRQFSQRDDLPTIPDQLQPGADTSDIRSQRMLFEYGRDLFGSLSKLHPLVLVLEDAHWADQASLEALRYMARWLTGERVLFVITYRDDETQHESPLLRALPDLVRTLQPLRLELRQLSTQSLAQLIDDRYQLGAGDRQRLVRFLSEYSDGNPFYILELLRSLELDQTLTREEGGWKLGDITGFRMPSLLRQIMTNRLADQADEARARLEIAAIIGSEVSFDLWATVCGASAEQLTDAFAHAHDLALVREVPGQASFVFSHALLRQALYERVPLPQRNAWHVRIGDTLAATARPPASLVAHHYRLAGDERAIDWLIRAGEAAQASYAWQAAIERYTEAAAALSAVPQRANDEGWLAYRIGTLARYGPAEESLPALERAERLGLQTSDPTLVAYSRFKQGVINTFNAESDQPLDDLRRAVSDVGKLNTQDTAPTGQLRSTLSGDPLGGEIPKPASNLGLGTLALRLASTGRHTEAEAAALEFLASIDEHPAFGDPGLVPYADAHTALAFVHTVRCRPDEARAALHKARDAYRRGDDRRAEALSYFAELTLVVNTFEHRRRDARQVLAEQAAAALQRALGAFPSELPAELFAFENLWLEGAWDQAVAYAQRGQFHMGADIILAEIALSRGQAEEVWRIVLNALPDGVQTKPGRPSFLVRLNLISVAARLCLAAAELDQARAWISCYAAWVDWSEMTVGLAELALLWAQFHAAAGERQKAHEQAQRALDLATIPQQALVLMPAHRLLAGLALDAQDFAAAEQHVRAALDVASQIGAPFEEALGWLAKAELLLSTGQSMAAMRLLNAAEDLLRQLGATPALANAHALRRHPAVVGESEYPGGLSAREVEVLRLVAAGLTDAEIGTQLFISRRTVSQHLRTIYAKLGIGSRVAAARFALENDLA